MFNANHIILTSDIIKAGQIQSQNLNQMSQLDCSSLLPKLTSVGKIQGCKITCLLEESRSLWIIGINIENGSIVDLSRYFRAHVHTRGQKGFGCQLRQKKKRDQSWLDPQGIFIINKFSWKVSFRILVGFTGTLSVWSPIHKAFYANS